MSRRIRNQIGKQLVGALCTLSFAIALFLPPSAIASVPCDPKAGIWNFGLEWVADTCISESMNDYTAIHFINNALVCDPNTKTVQLYAPYGDYVIAPADLAASAMTMTSSDGRPYKIFRNSQGTHFLTVHPDYVGTIDGIDMTHYAAGQVHTDVLHRGLVLPATPNCIGAESETDGKPELCNVGSSTNIITGRLSHQQELFSLSNNHSLALGVILSYGSTPFAPSSIGNGWSHNYEATLLPGGGLSMVFWEDGIRRVYKKYSTTGNFIPPLGDHSSLVQIGSNWVITEPDGFVRTFNSNGKLTSIVDRYTNSLTFTYDNDRLTNVTDSTGRTVTFGYNGTTGKLETVTDPKQNAHILSYTDGRLTGVTPPGNNGQWIYSYAANGLLETKTDPELNLTRYSYDATGRLQEVTDPLLKKRSFSMQPVATGYHCITEAGGGSTATSQAPPQPGKVPDVYKVFICEPPLEFQFVEKDQNSWRYTYDTWTMSVRSATDPNGNTTNYYYNGDGTMRAQTVPFNGTVRLTTFYTYDDHGNMLTETEPVDLSTYFPAIDPQTVNIASLASLNPPIKPAFIYTYDPASYYDIKTVTDNRGSIPLTTTFDRYTETDQSGGTLLVTRITAPGETAGTTLVSYQRQHTDGTLASFTDAGGDTTDFTYYPVNAETIANGTSGKLWSVSLPDGITVTFTAYDKNGNPTETKLTDANGSDIPVKTTQGYDALNRLTSILKQSTAEPLRFADNLTRYGYDKNSNRNLVTDAENRSTSYTYTYQGQVTEITDARQKTTKLEYGAAACATCGGGVDKLTAVRDANHVATGHPGTVYTYDKVGRLETETDPVGKKIRYTYYDSGLVKDKIDATDPAAEKLLISYRYNKRGQLTDKLYPDNTSVRFTYDANGRLETAANLTGATVTFGYTMTYHHNGRLKTVTDTTGKAISYDEYYGSGQRKKVTYFPGTAAQRVITYDYDAGRPWHIYSLAGTFTFGYDERGRRNKLSYPSGIEATYGYDDLDQLTSLNHGIPNGATIAANGYPDHDKVGNIKTRTGILPATYIYDELYRLTEAAGTSGTEKYGYDDVSNRTNGPGPKDTKYRYDATNRMTTGKLFAHDYDNAGNQTTRALPGSPEKSWVYTWNFENQLTKAEQTKGAEKRTVTFKYDPFGRRIEKKLTMVIAGQTKTTTSIYTYDNEDIILETLNDGTATTATRFVHGPGIDEPLALEREGQHYFYHADHLGSITTITDGSKTVVQSYQYDSFGNIKPQTGFRNSYTYTGREWDRETGLYFYRARYYDPMEGRFIAKDPISFSGGDVNLYGYVEGSPVNSADPWGLWAENVHQKKTYLWAKSLGFTDKEATLIAFGNNATDGGFPGWLPMLGQQSRHFNQGKKGCQDSRNYWANTEFKRAVKYFKQGKRDIALRVLGKGLHSLQDMFAHRDWNTGLLGWTPHPEWYDDVEDIRNLPALMNTRDFSKAYLNRFRLEVNK